MIYQPQENSKCVATCSIFTLVRQATTDCGRWYVYSNRNCTKLL